VIATTDDLLSRFNGFSKTVEPALRYLTHHANGPATLMRGKSGTC